MVLVDVLEEMLRDLLGGVDGGARGERGCPPQEVLWEVLGECCIRCMLVTS
jgi:hypothetical protein